MATLEDVRRIALGMPGAFESVDGHRGGATWRLKSGLFVWQRPPSATDLRTLAASGIEWPHGEVIALRTDGLEVKDELLHALPEYLFTIPHFDGWPAVLLKLDAIPVDVLEELVSDAWLARAPARARKAWLTERGLDPSEPSS